MSPCYTQRTAIRGPLLCVPDLVKAARRRVGLKKATRVRAGAVARMPNAGAGAALSAGLGAREYTKNGVAGLGGRYVSMSTKNARRKH